MYTSSASGAVDAAILTDVFRAMLSVEFSTLSYRHRMLYLQSLYSLRLHFTTHDMQYLYYDRLTPLLFASLHASPPLPLLQLLLAFLCHFLSSLPSSQRRHDLLLRLLRLYSPTSRRLLRQAGAGQAGGRDGQVLQQAVGEEARTAARYQADADGDGQ